MRLTKRTESGVVDCAYCTGKHTADGKGCSPNCELWDKQMEKLCELEDLEEQGLLLKLPCKEGDTIYAIVTKCEAEEIPEDYPCLDVEIDMGCSECKYKDEYTIIDFPATWGIALGMALKERSFWKWGENAFATKEEAEAALERMGE